MAALLIALVIGLYVTNSRTDKEPQTAATEQPTQLADSIAASQEEAGETPDGNVATTTMDKTHHRKLHQDPTKRHRTGKISLSL